jgi:ribonuclease P protein component
VPAAPSLPHAAARAASSSPSDGAARGRRGPRGRPWSVIFDHFPGAPGPTKIPRGTTPRTPRCGFAARAGAGPAVSASAFAGGVVLPQQSRMRSPEEFKRTMRSGRRAGGATLSGHLLLAAGPVPEWAEPKVGFVVSRAVGSAVVRNRVKRRLRELMRGRLASLPGGCLLVLRAHPAAAGARQADLAADLDLVLGRLLRRQVGALRQ